MTGKERWPKVSENDGAGTDRITVRACKYDGRLHRSWEARLARRDGSLIVLDAVFQEEILHPLLGRIAPGTLSTEYYWTDRWYSIFRFSAESGALRCFYCNINTPAEFDGRTLQYLDLDIDVLIAADFSYRVLDRDEFTANAARYGYPPEVLAGAERALTELIALLRGRQFPFA